MKRKSFAFAILDSPFFISLRRRAGEVRSEAGYSLVVLVVIITVLNIALAAMLPLWSTAIKREKEEELVFRGFQYAEAIRVFHQRYQRYPNKIEELIEIKPRCIRQLWKDPMTDDGKWVLIFQNQPQTSLQVQNPSGVGEEKPSGDEGGGAEPTGKGDDGDGRPQFGPRKGETVQIGPIIGVHSKSGKKASLLFFGHERYDEWQFTENLLLGGQQPPSIAPGVRDPGAPQQQTAFQMSTRWLGRPMRFFNQTPAVNPQDGTMPTGSPTGRPPTKPQPRRPTKP